MLDTSCAALLRLAQAVHEQGYKVALTGEGADEALAGYVWYKTQKVRDAVTGPIGRTAPAAAPQPGRAGRSAGRRTVIPAEQAIGGVRPAQQDLYEMIAQSKPILYSEAMWDRLGDHNPYADLDITNDRIAPLAPAEPVALRRLQGDARRPADDLQGRPDRDELVGRDAVPVPRRRRDRLLRGDRPGVQAARHDREVDPPPGRRPDPARADRQPAQDDVPRQPVADVPRPAPARLGRPAPEPRVAPRHRLLRRRPRCSRSGRCRRVLPRITPARFVFDVALTCVVSTQLWHHIYCGGGLCDLPTWEPPVVEAETVHAPAARLDENGG